MKNEIVVVWFWRRQIEERVLEPLYSWTYGEEQNPQARQRYSEMGDRTELDSTAQTTPDSLLSTSYAGLDESIAFLNLIASFLNKHAERLEHSWSENPKIGPPGGRGLKEARWAIKA